MDIIQVQEEIKKLQQERDKHVTSFFWLGIQIALVFGIPVAIAVIAGGKIDAYYGSGKIATTILMAVAFVSSWVIVLKKYRNHAKAIEVIESKIVTFRKKETELIEKNNV